MKSWRTTTTVIVGIMSILFLTGFSGGAEFQDYEMSMARVQQDAERILESNSGATTYLANSQEDVGSKVHFYIFARNNLNSMKYELVIGNSTSLRESPFDMTRPTKLLIHGYLDSAKGLMTSDVKNSVLVALDDNVIAVDWSAFTINVMYLSVAAKTHAVGLQVAKMIDFLVSEGYSTSKLHVIGFSLGAHVAGSAATAITKGRIPRISALDPALPGFNIIKVSRKLTKEDADFVDCIHTCGGLLGIYEPFCHADFYPNLGVHPQPGCPIADFAMCSHFRSFRFFAESMLKNHVFPALKCESVNENCKESSVRMGNYLNSTVRGIYYLDTLREYPFAPDRL